MNRFPISNYSTRCARLLLLLSAAILFSCAGGSKSRTPDLLKITPEQIQAKVARNFSKLTNFEGQARVIIELPGEGHTGSAKVRIGLPDSVYVKTEAMLGIDIGALFLDRSVFGAYAPRDNVLYYGETELLDLRDFLQIEIETEEIVEVLTGAGQVWLDSNPTLSWDKNSYLISCQRWQGVAKYWVDPKKYVVTRSEVLDGSGQIILLKEFDRLKTRKGIVLPQTIRITRPLARERLTVYYTKQDLNKAIPPAKFKLKTANNAKRVYWGDVVKTKTNGSR